MPIFEYNGKKYNVPDDKVEGFKSRKPEATLINSAPFYLADDKTVKNPQSANTVDPVQDDITNAAQRQDGFWATGVGDAIEKLGAGTLNTVGGIAKVLQETPTGKLVKKFSDYATEKTGVKPFIENNDVAGYLSKEGQKLSEKGDFHGNIVDEETGQVRKKTYRDLWKEGNKLGALGEVMLTATESAPTSALAMMPGGLALVSASAAGQKYSEINSNPETKDLPEWKKWLNASVSGVIEGATEKLGAKVDLKMIEPFLKKMTETTVKGILKKGGVNALIQTISEGAEEVLSQLGTNVVDYATGVSDEYKPFEGVQDSFVYGAGGGAQFGGVTGSAAVYRASTYAKDRHNANKVVKDADQQAGELFDGWDEVKSQLSGMSAEERTETLRDVLKRDNISIPAKKAFTDYVSGITYKESLTGAAEAKAVQDAEAGKETGQRLYDTLNDKRSIALSSLNIEKQELEAQLGDLASLPLTEIEESPEATPDIINAARKYNIVKSEFDGVMDRLRSEVDAYVQPQIESLEQVAKDGTITELNIGSSENPETVYLLSGDISFNEDGTVNREASLSPTINVKGSDGKKRQIGTHHVISGKVDNLEQAKETIRQIAYDKYVNPLADKMEGKRHFELNETVEFVDDKGKTVAGKVNGKQGQAVQVLHSDGKTTSTFTESELDQRLIGESLGDIRIRDKFPVNIDGESLDAEVQDISDGKATLYIPNNPVASRRFIEVSLDEINEMRTMPVSGPQEIDKTLENTPQNEGIATGPVQQNEIETAETGTESQNETAPISEAQQSIQEFPKDKDGNIDYAKITDNAAYVEALRSEFGDEAHNVVDEYKKAAEKALKGVDKINDPIRKRREQARRQAELDRWNVMFEATRPKQQAPTYEEEYNPILTKNSRERESQMGDYVSLRDFLLRNIGTGKLRFMWNSRDGRKGLKDEILSSKNTNAERLRRIAFLDNNGFTPESLAEFINDNHGQDIPEFSTLDVQDVRNEINDVLLSFDTPTDMIEAAERLRRDDMSLESYTEQNVSPEEIANYEANEVSQDDVLQSMPEQQLPEISEQEIESLRPQRDELKSISEMN